MSKKGENIYKRKDGRWEGRYKKGTGSNGKTVYGSCYGKTYREAKEKLELLKKNLPAGCQSKKLSGRETFGMYCDEWLAVNKNRVKESTVAKYSVALENHIKPFFGKFLPETITTAMTAEFADHLLTEKKLSAKTAKDIMIVLKAVLRFIVNTGNKGNLIEVAMPRYKYREIRVLSHQEQQIFVDYLIKDMDSSKFGILFALMTGLRIGEVCALRTGDVSLADRTVTVRVTMQRIKNMDGGAKTKIVFSEPKSSNSSRIVPLTSKAIELCRERVLQNSPESFLLTGSETKHMEPRVLQYRIKKYSMDCGIEDLHFHVLRHTFATRCVEVGFEIKSLSEVLGHSTPNITLARYVHSSLEFKRQNMTKLEAAGL